MENREEILLTLKTLMAEMFEIDAEAVRPEVRLYEDLDFDSIDAVDMVVRLKEITGKAVKAEDFKSARTVGDVIEAVYSMLHA
jgi:acyl carrier protein